jgi:uncharacterized protein DUF3105
MASKEERERRREERLATERAEEQAARRRLIAGYVVAGLLGLAVVAGLVIVLASGGEDSDDPADVSAEAPENAHIQGLSGVTHGVAPDDREGTPPPPIEQGDSELAAKEAGCVLETGLPDEGNEHVDDKEVKYKSDPPTSGNHNPEQQADGAYAEMPDPVNFVHSLEHGRVEVQYSPELSEAEQLELKGVFDESPEAMLFFPNPEMKPQVAATAWTNLLTCDSYKGQATLDAIRAFRDVYRGQGPENVPLMTG